jgi:hypothetical protein
MASHPTPNINTRPWISLFQKASVRSALNEAREEQQTASSNRDKWERRVVGENLDYVD